MFIDYVEIFIFSGNGGDGAVSFRREKFVINGGPDGGDGGDGGDVYFMTDNNTDTLSNFRGKKHYRAQNGQPGEGKNRTGKRGEDLIIKVPAGTIVKDKQTGEVLCELVRDGEKICVLKGGRGGFGNTRFKTSVNQRPDYAKHGLKGEEKEVILELKLIADVGLVGYPNVGKSTLISTLSNAKPEIANYEFTTLTPHLGVVNLEGYYSFVMADIPGIIDGASEGKGLGIEFLRHIERTKFLLFVIDSISYRDLLSQYTHLREELKKFSQELYKRDFGVVLSKVDSLEDFQKIDEFIAKIGVRTSMQEWEKDSQDSLLPHFILPISAVTHQNLDELKHQIFKALS